MRLELLEQDEGHRVLGAIVVTQNGAEVRIDAGPADGLPVVRITLTRLQALQLSSNLRAVSNGRDEEILLGEQ